MIVLYKKNNKGIVEPVRDYKRYNDLLLNPDQGEDSFTDIMLAMPLLSSKFVVENFEFMEERFEVEEEPDLPDEDD